MEQKAWRWRRKSSEKTLATNEKIDLLFVENEQEKAKVSELERDVEELEEQLSSLRIESNAKDDLLAKQVKIAEEAIAGHQKAETEAGCSKKELADALLQNQAAEEKIVSRDVALKECMQQLHAANKKNQHTVIDASSKISSALENARAMEKSLVEANRNLANLSRILEVKEKLIEELIESKSCIEAKFSALVTTQDTLNKDNASLNYEIFMLRKELEIRNQDRDFHIKSADASHNKYLESIKKITKLESECQRLRVMVRKRLPGPGAIAKMRSEVEILGNSTSDTPRKSSHFADDYDSSSKRVASLIERLRVVEDENKILKETLVKKNNELHSLRLMFARTASKLSQTETQLEEFSKGRISLDLAKNSSFGDEDALSCSESWASALISELDHFRNGKAKTSASTTLGVSEFSLMDDFIEMEKLAIVCVDKESEAISSDATGKEIVLAEHQNETKNKEPCQSDLEKPMCTIIEGVEEIIKRFHTIKNDQKHNIFSPREISELCSALQNFLVVCNDLLHGKADFKIFTHELALTVKCIIKLLFANNESHEEPEELNSKFESKLKDENMKLRSEIKDAESRCKDLADKNESLSSQLKESDEKISSLQVELMTSKCSTNLIEDQIENQRLIAEDISTQLTVAKAELKEARQRFSSLEVELEDKTNCCEELETACLDLQLQIESVATNETRQNNSEEEEKQLRTDLEISAASEKLAECQATILNLGKQLKALASPKDAPLFDKIATPAMHPEEETASEHLKSPKTKEIICAEIKQPPRPIISANNPNAGLLYGRKFGYCADIAINYDGEFERRKDVHDVGKLVLVQKRHKGGVGFLRKLFLKKKTESSKKKALPIGS